MEFSQSTSDVYKDSLLSCSMVNNNNIPSSKLQEIGYRRVYKLRQEYENLGYFVLINTPFYSGVDMIIIDKTGRISKVLEVTNYQSPKEYIKDHKLTRYINSLNFYDDLPNVEKILVISFGENLTKAQIQRLSSNKINVRIEGRQD